jgi:hypothetical protein
MPLPNVYFGKVEDGEPEIKEDETPDDDKELAETPADVTELLGFDPKELDSKGFILNSLIERL